MSVNVEQAMRVIKVKYYDSIKKCLLPEEISHFETFYDKVVGLFSKRITNNNDIIIEYLDDAKDWILIENMDDLSLALQTGSLYIRIKESSPYNKKMDDSMQQNEMVDGIKGLGLSAKSNSSRASADDNVRTKSFVPTQPIKRTESQTNGEAQDIFLYKGPGFEADLLTLGAAEPRDMSNISLDSSSKGGSTQNHYGAHKDNTNVSSAPVSYHPKQPHSMEPNLRNQQQQQPPFQQSGHSQGFYGQSSSGNARPPTYSTSDQQQLPPPQQRQQQQPPPLGQPPYGARPPVTPVGMGHQGGMNIVPPEQGGPRGPPTNMRPGFPNPMQGQIGSVSPHTQMQPPMGPMGSVSMPPRQPVQSGSQPPLHAPGMGMQPQSYSGGPPLAYPPSHGPTPNQGNRFPPPGHFQPSNQ